MDFEIEETIDFGKRACLRTAKMETSKGDIEFPQRIATNTDIYHAERIMKTDVKCIIDIPSSLYEIKRAYPKESLTAMAKSKKVLSAETEKVKRIMNKKHGSFRIFNPVISQMKAISSEENRALLEMQEECGFDAKKIFDSRDLSAKQLEARIKTSLKEIQEHAKITVVMPLSQKPEILEEKIKTALANTDGISYRFASPSFFFRQFQKIKSFSKEKKWFSMTDVPKMWKHNDRTSLMHILAFYGLDSFSLRTGKMFVKRPLVLKRCDIGTLGYLTFPAEHSTRYGDDLNCHARCPIDIKRNLTDFMDDFSPEERISAARVHEAFDSQFEFSQTRTFALEGKKEVLNHYRAHEFAKQPFKALLDIDFNQQTL